MKERPIIMQSYNAEAIAAGIKTQTRRVIKFPHDDYCVYMPNAGDHVGEWVWEDCSTPHAQNWPSGVLPCPYGVPGDFLWVKETWGIFSTSWTDIGWEGDGLVDWPQPKAMPQSTMHNRYDLCYRGSGFESDGYGRWYSPLSMPRWASRLTLRISNVRAERLHDIREQDAIAEGMMTDTTQLNPFSAWPSFLTPKAAFRQEWERINAKRGFGWETDPWVWVIEFERHIAES